jgi:hypothetical protein
VQKRLVTRYAMRSAEAAIKQDDIDRSASQRTSEATGFARGRIRLRVRRVRRVGEEVSEWQSSGIP